MYIIEYSVSQKAFYWDTLQNIIKKISDLLKITRSMII